jgi:hypothetical protein
LGQGEDGPKDDLALRKRWSLGVEGGSWKGGQVGIKLVWGKPKWAGFWQASLRKQWMGSNWV